MFKYLNTGDLVQIKSSSKKTQLRGSPYGVLHIAALSQVVNTYLHIQTDHLKRWF